VSTITGSCTTSMTTTNAKVKLYQGTSDGRWGYIGIYTLTKSGQVNFLWSNNDVTMVIELIPQWALKFYTSPKTFIPPQNKFLERPLRCKRLHTRDAVSEHVTRRHHTSQICCCSRATCTDKQFFSHSPAPNHTIHRVSKKLCKIIFVRTLSNFHQLWKFLA